MTTNPMKGNRGKFDNGGKKSAKFEDDNGVGGRLFGGRDSMGGEETISEEVNVGREG